MSKRSHPLPGYTWPCEWYREHPDQTATHVGSVCCLPAGVNYFRCCGHYYCCCCLLLLLHEHAPLLCAPEPHRPALGFPPLCEPRRAKRKGCKSSPTDLLLDSKHQFRQHPPTSRMSSRDITSACPSPDALRCSTAQIASWMPTMSDSCASCCFSCCCCCFCFWVAAGPFLRVTRVSVQARRQTTGKVGNIQGQCVLRWLSERPH